MISISQLIEVAETQGYPGDSAEAKVCQDLILKAISESKMSRNATIKGGVVMRSLSSSSRRATVDIDVDFIRYSIENDSIDAFIHELNCLEGVVFERVGNIETLHQQDYRGRRAHIRVSDESGFSISSKVDFGVHKDLDIKQELFCFEVSCFDGKAKLLINSKEQMVAEKTKSLLRFGPRSTRYKDVFDIYYLLPFCELKQLDLCFAKYVFGDFTMRERTYSDVAERLEKTFGNRTYVSRLSSSGKSWIGVPAEDVFQKILSLFKQMGRKVAAPLSAKPHCE